MHVKDLVIPAINNDVIIMMPEDFYLNYHRNIENRDELSERVPFCYTDDFDKMFLVLKDKEKIIASLTMKVFPEDKMYGRDSEILSMMAIGVDKHYRNKGYAKKLIDVYFEIIELNNITPSHSYWESDGKQYLSDYWEYKKENNLKTFKL